MHEFEYNYSKKVKIIELSLVNQHKRLDHCKKYLNNNLDNIIFSDESYFKEYNYSEKAW